MKKHTKLKICGMTQEDEVFALVNLGVDAIGVILHAQSPRLITLEQAKILREKIPAFITMVGVFVDCEVSVVNEYATEIGLDLVQLHGAESHDYALQLVTPYIKAVRAKNIKQVKRDIVEHSSARAILLDPYVKGQHGGTGQELSVDVWPSTSFVDYPKMILAGGLSPMNLRKSLEQFSPYGVDLNSGLEHSPGRKNLKKVEECIAILRG